MSDTNYKELSSKFEQILKHYLVNCNSVKNVAHTQNTTPELEIRFGTNPKVAKPISTIDYRNVADVLLSNGWKSDTTLEGNQMLRIISEVSGKDVPKQLLDKKNNAEEANEKKKSENKDQPVSVENSEKDNAENENGTENEQSEENEENEKNENKSLQEGGAKWRPVMSNIRAEIEGANNIQEYCQYNDLERFKRPYTPVYFTKKKRVINPETGKPFEMVNFEDHNFRVSYMEEEMYKMTSNYMPVKKLIYDWPNTKKTYRCMNRVRFKHESYPVFVDMSIVKTNKKNMKRDGNRGSPIPTNTIQESEVFNMVPIYEVELEIDNERVKELDANSTSVDEIMAQIKKCIRLVLSGLQETPFPIPYSEQESILHAYMCRMYGDKWEEHKNPRPFFMGPQSVALQLEHMVEHDPDVSSHISILRNYTVTEKADGVRALMYVSKKGKVYLISSNLKVMFTGSVTKEKKCFDSLLDGEFIMYGKHPLKKQLFLYAAFDIYYFGGMEKDAHVRPLPFSSNDEAALQDKYRLSLLQKFHALCKLESVVPNPICELQFRCKHFEQYKEGEQTITEASDLIWSKTYDYEIDGLIFTPMNTGVGGSKPNEAYELNGKKFTWGASFKWKPPHYNTIDFLVHTQKDKDGQDLIRHIAHDGDNMLNKVVSYKTLILHVGFDKKKHKYMNAFHDVLYGNDEYFEKMFGSENESKYEAMPFVPTVPYDPESYLCNIELESSISEKLHMKTIEGDIFHEDMIVEFQYVKDDPKKTGPWRWVPLRVRQDKTQALREGQKSMNNYTTADTNWRSIHYPVTEKMIVGKESVPAVEVNDSIYYNLTEKIQSTTIALRDFHNMYIKRKLINGVSMYLRNKMRVDEPMLIDYAVGKGGDLAKWSYSKLSFVLGIDVHGDNITNSEDGACVRYLRWRQKNKKHPMRALFLEGNSSANIRTKGSAFKSSMDKEIVQSVFGHGKNTNAKKYVFQHGIAQEGFHISSCQFSMHYFFENTKTLHNFLRNLAECTRLHGYFIGTCFDGESIFKFLYKRKDGTLIRNGESVRIDKNGRKMFEITKKYDTMVQEFLPDETSIGMAIKVYQESIDKEFIEYLVNFEYFVRLMENYGFVLVEKEELRSMGISEASGLFNRMYGSMKRDIENDPEVEKEYREAPNMSSFEKTVSFLNRYFIFKKVRELSQASLTQMVIDRDDQSAEDAIADLDAEDADAAAASSFEINADIDSVPNDVDAIASVSNKEPTVLPGKKSRKKIKLPKVLLNEDNYSPIDVLFEDDPKLQAFYETMKDKQKKMIYDLPLRDRKMIVRKLMEKKQQKGK